jgi:hypothetical protein
VQFQDFSLVEEEESEGGFFAFGLLFNFTRYFVVNLVFAMIDYEVFNGS